MRADALALSGGFAVGVPKVMPPMHVLSLKPQRRKHFVFGALAQKLLG